MSPILEENDDGSQRDENGPKFPLRKEQGQDVYPGLGDPGAGALSLSLHPSLCLPILATSPHLFLCIR